MKEKRQSPVGTTPYGWRRKDGSLVRDIPEQDIISEMIQLREEKNYSFSKIAAFLNENFFASKRNGLWYGNVVQAILERETPV